MRLDVSASGEVVGIERLADTLVVDPGQLSMLPSREPSNDSDDDAADEKAFEEEEGEASKDEASEDDEAIDLGSDLAGEEQRQASNPVQQERSRVLGAIFGELANVTFEAGDAEDATSITIPFVFD